MSKRLTVSLNPVQRVFVCLSLKHVCGVKIATDLQVSPERWLCFEVNTHQSDSQPW